MDAKEVVQTNSNEAMKHIFRYDDETKTTLTNLIQYTMLAIIPISCLQKASDTMFSDYDESNGTMALLAEILGQSLLTIVGLFMIHRIITAIPTFSGTAMEDIHLTSIIVVFLLISLHCKDNKMHQKFAAVMNRTFDAWDGKQAPPKKEDKKQPKVSVSQPISNNGMPTHQVSRADYIGTHSNLTAPQPPVHQSPSIADQQNIYAQEAPPMLQEPMAANEGFGVFSAF
jgi:hypothetical protein